MTSTPETYPRSLADSYAQSGFGGAARTLPFGRKPVLLVIDVCNAYLTPGGPLYAPDRFDAALRHIEQLISHCRSNKIPVIFTRVIYRNPQTGGNWYKLKLPRALCCFDDGNEFGSFPSSSQICQPETGETVIEKQYSSCFFGTSLASLLIAERVENLVICGFSTSGCVRSTATDAMQYGFNPYVVGDACGDRHAYPHDANLFDIQAKFGEVISTEEMLHLLTSCRNVDEANYTG